MESLLSMDVHPVDPGKTRKVADGLSISADAHIIVPSTRVKVILQAHGLG